MIASGRIPAVEPAARLAPRVRWQILTGEYPPQPGGVSAYTRLVARALAEAGDHVDVWAPPCATAGEPDPGVSVRRLPDRFGRRSLDVLDRQLDALPDPRRVLVQYVPHAFGWKAANVPFALWLRSRRRDSVWIMFHEVAYPVGAGYGVGENLLGAITRRMAAIAGRAAERIFVSIPAWQPVVESLAGTRAPIVWLPVPSTISPVDDPAGSALVRSRVAQGRPVVGHLGTYGRLIRPMLEASLRALLSMTDCSVLLLGRQGDTFRDELMVRHPQFGGRIVAPGDLSDVDLSHYVSACDVMLQPYPDGVSSRRTSVMVALAHGRPVVTNVGPLSEPLWSECRAVVIAGNDSGALAASTLRVLSNRTLCRDLSARARALYAERFDLTHTVDRLREVPVPPA